MHNSSPQPGRLAWLILAVLVGTATHTPAALRLNIVTTLPDLASIAREVGGDRVSVTSLAKGTEDPHFVDARPSFIRTLNQADILVEVGAELEVGWLPALVSSARNARITGVVPGHVVASRGIRLLGAPAGPVDRSAGDVHPGGNPHYNLDPANGPIMAATIADALAALDPAGADGFRANQRRFQAAVEARLGEWTRKLAPYRGIKVVTYHRSFDYLLDRFGFELAGTIEPKPGVEPSPTHINVLIPKAREAGVKLVLVEPNRPRRTAQRIAEGAGARLVVLPIMVQGSEQATDYLRLFDYVVEQLAGALKP
jgi:zinc/manganese transport system substrate-binding protein